MAIIYRDKLHRITYSTDASIYREMPVGVAYPSINEEIRLLIDSARKENTCLIPRAGGTSIAGQVVGNGIVVDISRYFIGILEIDPARRLATVQPGVVRDELNIALKPYGLFFSPETSTSNRCCIGGMMGNNSCGAHSLVYGSTRHHVVSAKGILSDGSQETFKDYTVSDLEVRFGKKFWEKEIEGCTLIQNIYSQLINYALSPDVTAIIDNSYPDRQLRRRSCGYAIDEVIEDLRNEDKPFEDRIINLCKLLTGSEGTLAFITEITVSLDPLPPAEKMMICAHCDSLEDSFKANLIALEYNPSAIELMDRPILKLSEDNIEQQKNRFFLKGDPAAVLCIELNRESKEELDRVASEIEDALMSGENPKVYHCTRVSAEEMNKVYNLRKAGLGLLNGMKGDAKPVGVIEDTAVSPKRLGAFVKDIQKMLAELCLSCVFYGHISTGELHLRPIINIKTSHGRLKFRSVAYETALLVKKHKGSLSGEHGDGRLRGEYIPLVYGNDAYQLMRKVKKTWDPDGVFNVGKITDTPPMDKNLRYEGNKYAVSKEIGDNGTYYNWRASFDECTTKGVVPVTSQCHALMCSVEQCNGAGDCRKSNLIGGTMCPAFKESHDELKATRARANVIREILTKGDESEIFESKILKEVLDSCLACKGCKSECPSNVDMTKLRSELLQHFYDKDGIPLKTRLISRLSTINKLASPFALIYNSFLNIGLVEMALKKSMNFAIERSIPHLSRKTMRRLVKGLPQQKTGRKVYLFADEFINYQEAETGLAFAKLLIALGYEVEIPKHSESGRASISKGDLKHAKKCATRNVEALSDIISESSPLVGIEPSCILSFRDEYPDLVDPGMRDKAKTLAKNCLLYDEFLLKELNAGRINPDKFKHNPIEIWLHGHCHQKALVGIDKTTKILEELLSAKVNVIPSGCCGMAGSFGYEKPHYKTSMQIGEMILFPTVRNAVNKSEKNDLPMMVAAPGISCRQQILDGTGIKSVHPIEILLKHLNQ